ncbi:MAG: bifunctional precorrin-2 dehydrogenase/sirohydrochlorin ferrochelatase [Thermoplasmata archaeon]|nr:bifunctional precorrin-2 dehydrogenase/sirohydrochlorin ferrochelatase [Candidatus Sysuiplasma acidicola]MBX8637785.1 bifunctional precorrin-2 dehydrogenase/sirohydrochlorin ferrochelatase [Candidatus Sysuiplasma acidicola]MBX8646649.1 bifunctional precorrin-2 dehydrogenase/sirohydrochlorin ferrochelatase [Candidatus Sysuiplasma acidicola]MDH2905916.1 bifunctional precorrin-2 dehydrogenase/sirohydrochlorin ferrochelatase [Methanomassiliicoccales archaeon]
MEKTVNTEQAETASGEAHDGAAGHFPLMISLRDKDIVIVGGGEVAYHKASLLRPYARSITVLSEEFSEKFNNLDVKKIVASGRDIKTLMGKPFLLICATDDHELNNDLMMHCRRNGILCNNVDVLESDVYFGSMIKSGPLTISISTNGMSPTMARFTRETLTEALDRSFWEMLGIQTELRSKLRHSIPEMRRRKEVLDSIVYDPDIWALLEGGKRKEAMELAVRKVNGGNES